MTKKKPSSIPVGCCSPCRQTPGSSAVYMCVIDSRVVDRSSDLFHPVISLFYHLQCVQTTRRLQATCRHSFLVVGILAIIVRLSSPVKLFEGKSPYITSHCYPLRLIGIQKTEASDNGTTIDSRQHPLWIIATGCLSPKRIDLGLRPTEGEIRSFPRAQFLPSSRNENEKIVGGKQTLPKQPPAHAHRMPLNEANY